MKYEKRILRIGIEDLSDAFNDHRNNLFTDSYGTMQINVPLNEHCIGEKKEYTFEFLLDIASIDLIKNICEITCEEFIEWNNKYGNSIEELFHEYPDPDNEKEFEEYIDIADNALEDMRKDNIEINGNKFDIEWYSDYDE